MAYIKDFDFKKGNLVLLRNSRIKESLNWKTKPHHIGPMLIVCKKRNISYVIVEFNSVQSQQHVAGSHLIPYYLCENTDILIVLNLSNAEQDDTVDDPMEEDGTPMTLLPPSPLRLQMNCC